MIRVLIAEDITMVRDALAALLNLESDIKVVAELGGGEGVVHAAIENRVDVAVLDIALPGIDGICAAERLREEVPDCRALMLTSLGNPAVLKRALAAKVGGILLKDAPVRELADAIRQVATGRRVINPTLALMVLDSADSPLTARETEVLTMAADGNSVLDIASQVYLSAGTVRNYLTSIVSKLNARNRVDAVRIARESNWI